ncbi:HNH endonuclease [Marivirga sp. S37H4]|uniref:HNH endonuclease n=1 Tax=Marivirga aurantiaca TaxID=2802615 RepID=A0A934X0D2_9BACT|nr:HNH endonuclease [Marivirga aurantiaca]MBK6266344.1 HNH endonuclease [Marivirga aurantiaca]
MRIGSKRALVLNQDYSPITVCNIQKAFLLVYLNKAEILETDDVFKLRTITKAFPLPSVIRLISYVNRPYKGVMLTRQNVFKRDAHTCQYCGVQKDLTLDHLIPRSKGGKSSWNNLVTACKRCNARKGDAKPEESGMVLRRVPFKPSYVMFIRDFSGSVSENWLPFLKTKEILVRS